MILENITKITIPPMFHTSDISDIPEEKLKYKFPILEYLGIKVVVGENDEISKAYMNFGLENYCALAAINQVTGLKIDEIATPLGVEIFPNQNWHEIFESIFKKHGFDINIYTPVTNRHTLLEWMVYHKYSSYMFLIKDKYWIAYDHGLLYAPKLISLDRYGGSNIYHLISKNVTAIISDHNDVTSNERGYLSDLGKEPVDHLYRKEKTLEDAINSLENVLKF